MFSSSSSSSSSSNNNNNSNTSNYKYTSIDSNDFDDNVSGNSKNNKNNKSNGCNYGIRDLLMNIFGVLIGVIFVFIVLNAYPGGLAGSSDSGASESSLVTTISSDADTYSTRWDVVSSLESNDKASDGLIVAIRSFKSGLLMNPSNSNKVRVTDTYEDNRVLWKVQYINNGDHEFTFQNEEDGCYLKAQSGNLQCLDNANKNYKWYQYSTLKKSTSDNGDYQRYYVQLRNSNNDECFRFTGCNDDQSGINDGNCDDEESLVVFEIVN